METELTDAVPEAPPSRRRRAIVGGLAVLVAVAMLASAWPDGPRPVAPTPAIAADPSTVTIVAGAPASIDPAKHGDLGSASYISQVYETLNAKIFFEQKEMEVTSLVAAAAAIFAVASALLSLLWFNRIL